MAKVRSAKQMGPLLAQWRASGESGASFARRHDIPTWTFWYWKRKLSTTPAAGPGPRPFVPVQIALEESPVMELVFPSGERLQVRAGASADVVRAAVSALRTVC